MHLHMQVHFYIFPATTRKGRSMNHLEFAKLESDGLAPTPWDKWHQECTDLCKEYLNTNHLGIPTWDEDDTEQKFGYSLDWLFEQYESQKTPQDILKIMSRDPVIVTVEVNGVDQKFTARDPEGLALILDKQVDHPRDICFDGSWSDADIDEFIADPIFKS